MTDIKRDYTDYDKVSRSYDFSRTTLGLDIILEFLSCLDLPLNEQKIISIGCGTGNYEIELAKKVKYVLGLDISRGMINEARRKSGSIGNVEFKAGDALRVGYMLGEDEKYDAALFLFSLHHIGNKQQQVRAIKEAYRIIKPKGEIIFKVLSHEQLGQGLWWGSLLSDKTRKKENSRHMLIKDLINLLNKTGFNKVKRIVPLNETFIKPEIYLDYMGIFNERWRSGSSTWSLIEHEGELETAQSAIRGKIESGTIDKFMEEREKKREKVGQMTFVYGRKI